LIHVNSNCGESDKNKVVAILRIPAMKTINRAAIPLRQQQR
jgi:hypothetical protein